MSGAQGRYDVTVEEVHSGDDLVLLVNLGIDNLFKLTRARLRGVDTPSAFRAARDTEAGRVRDAVKAVVSEGKCSIELHSQGKGGWMVSLFVTSKDGRETVSVNQMLIDQGYVYSNKQES